MPIIVAEGTQLNKGMLEQYESEFNEYEKGELIIYTRYSVSDSVVEGIDTAIRKTGVHLTHPVTQAADGLHIRFQKRIPALALIAAIVIGLAIIFVVAWQLIKRETAPYGIPLPVWIVGGGAFVYLIARALRR